MASVKIILRSKTNLDGTHSLALQIIKDRKKSVHHLGHSILKTDWDAIKQRVKKSNPNSARLNNFLTKKVVEAEDKLLELQAAAKDNSARSIRNSLDASKQGTFFKQAALYCDQLEKHGKFNRLSADKPRIQRLREFLEGSDINFSDIDTALLKKFKAWLKGTRNISDRTIVNHLVVIRTIYNQAIAANLVDHKHYPFGKGKIVIKFPDTLKIGLTPEEVKKLEDIELPQGENHARNLWLLSFYFAGMRVSDVLRLKWSDFQNDRLYYAMGKNAKGGSLKVPDKVLRILEQYRRTNPKHDLVFPDLEGLDDLTKAYNVQARIKTRVKSANQYLQSVVNKLGLEKPLTMHISRHTFGNISGDKIPIQMLQKLYRHTSITTTIGYQSNFLHKDADDALDKVINF